MDLNGSKQTGPLYILWLAGLLLFFGIRVQDMMEHHQG